MQVLKSHILLERSILRRFSVILATCGGGEFYSIHPPYYVMINLEPSSLQGWNTDKLHLSPFLLEPQAAWSPSG
ncbi:hypothetical protein CEXT_377401 [Caerostris extrusa]|uniref:Uncharacterized protein n=1 Tax=Caerostris extrusa TaxID=172846 RepID=A0AAV4QC62_CAEEX|nr:hypothetical protein CEXT_377401 [Caerostris extrusa]